MNSTSNSRRVFIWAITAVLLGGAVWGMYILARNGGTNTSPLGQAGQVDAVSSTDWTYGNPQSGVVLIEYSDFQCPACRSYYPIIKELKEKNGNEFLFVYRHFPLSQHANAKPAGYAAEAAGKQGKFWEMHDLIFDNQNTWSALRNADKLFEGYAQALGLDVERFKNDFGASEARDRVQEGINSGLRAGVNATPTFFLNGKRIQPLSYDEFVTAIRGVTSTPSPQATQ